VTEGYTDRTGWRRLGQRAERTPPQRDRHVDLLRAVAISVVVIGHWLAAAITYDDGVIGGRNVLEVLPWTRLLSWLFQVMPVFFLVGGYANAASLTAHRRRGGTATTWLIGRTDRLLRPTTAFIVTIGAAALVARTLGVDPELVGTGTWLASIPLWFLLVYLAVVALTPAMHALHRRIGLLVPVLLAGLVAAGDFARYRLEFPYLAYGNYLLAWLAVHQFGFAWRDGRLPTRPRAALPLAVGGLITLMLLTVAGPYPISMVAVPGEPGQNTAPPTLALLALATAQTGLALLVSEPSNRWLRHTRAWAAVVAVNAVILTVFLWHMTAVLIAAVVLYTAGPMPQPPVGSTTWLLLRLPWLACLTLILAVLVTVFAPVELRSSGQPHPAAPGDGAAERSRLRVLTLLTVVGVATVAAGLLGVTIAGRGDHGPAGLPTTALLGYLFGAAALQFARWYAAVRHHRS
jgi:hypothetical protein